MKTVLLLALTLILASCGKSGSNANSGKDQNPDTCKSLCMPKVAWTITSNAVNFPKNFELKTVEGFKVDTCVNPRFFKVSKNEQGKMDIKFNFPFVPKNGFPVEIIDRGEHCDNNAIFHSEDSVIFGSAEISINGQVRSREVYVTLNN